MAPRYSLGRTLRPYFSNSEVTPILGLAGVLHAARAHTLSGRQAAHLEVVLPHLVVQQKQVTSKHADAAAHVM